MSVLSMDYSKIEGSCLDNEKANFSELRDGSELRHSNIAFISKIKSDRYASSMKANNDSSAFKDSFSKFCCQKGMPVYNTLTRTLKHQTVTKLGHSGTSTYVAEPGCSTSKIYGMQCEEELCVPSDVLNSKKKSLDIEVCMNAGNNDERIGSAESAGSHDSINQEIHHFKPIKAMPRTPLKLSADGKQIDPKLIRVIPILKRVSTVVPKPPSPTHLKRIIGCSWSAFRGKAIQDLKTKENVCNIEGVEELKQKPSTSLAHQPNTFPPKLTKSQPQDMRRADIVPELSFDSNKNYAKNIGKIINGTKVNKRLILDEHIDSGKVQKLWKSHVRNGMVMKSRRYKNLWISKKDTGLTSDTAKEADDRLESSNCSFTSSKKTLQSNRQEENSVDNLVVENIAERMKRRKASAECKTNDSKLEIDENGESKTTHKNVRRKRILPAKTEDNVVTDLTPTVMQKRIRSTTMRNKQEQAQKPSLTSDSIDKTEKDNSSSLNTVVYGLRKSCRNNNKTASNNSSKKDNQAILNKRNLTNKRNHNPFSSCHDMQEKCISENNNSHDLDLDVDKSTVSNDDILKEQERIEKLLLQEKEDFELARRLQAKFDEMERIAGRTRRSQKVVESENIAVDLYKVDVARGMIHKAARRHTAKQSTVNQTVSSVSSRKQRGRPRKGIK